MIVHPNAHTVTDIDVESLRRFMATHREDDFLVIDVREPDEYSVEHVPGAKLLPLLMVEEEAAALGRDQHKFFYCRSGMRSARAAQFVAQEAGLPRVYNVQGGIMAWQGETLPDFPKIRAVDTDGPLPRTLEAMINLEKGALRLYEALSRYFADGPLEKTIERLTESEEDHARALHDLLGKHSETPLEPFESLFARLEGDLLESGDTFDDILERANAVAKHGSPALLELALDMEYKAYDLYRNLADRADSPVLTPILLDLAHQERGHIQLVIKALASVSRL